MPPYGLDEDRFWSASPAAAEIFEYRKNHPELQAMPWGFKSGNVAEDKQRTWATFECVSLSGWGKDELYISANRQPDGSWKLTHSIKRAPG